MPAVIRIVRQMRKMLLTKIDIGGFQFRKDLHAFSYQDSELGYVMSVMTKKDDHSDKTFLALLKVDGLKDLARLINIAVVEIPEGKEITDMFITPSGKLATCSVTISAETT